MTEAEARREILEKVREYYHCFHDGKRWDGKHVSYGGRVYNEREMENLTEAMETVRPYAVDLSSGIESNRKKDPEKMRRIMELVEQYRNNTD